MFNNLQQQADKNDLYLPQQQDQQQNPAANTNTHLLIENNRQFLGRFKGGNTVMSQDGIVTLEPNSAELSCEIAPNEENLLQRGVQN